MDSLPAFIPHILTLADQLKYPLIFLVTILEGPILMIACGFLLHAGFFNFLPLFIALLAGDLVGDIVWYFVGRHGIEPFLRRHGRFMGVTPETFEKAKVLFHRYHKKILFISKLTLGFGMALATLMVAGATRVKFGTYMLINLVGEIILVSILLLIGYFFGNTSEYLAGWLKYGFIAGIIIFGGLALYGFSNFVKQKITSE